MFKHRLEVVVTSRRRQFTQQSLIEQFPMPVQEIIDCGDQQFTNCKTLDFTFNKLQPPHVFLGFKFRQHVSTLEIHLAEGTSPTEMITFQYCMIDVWKNYIFTLLGDIKKQLSDLGLLN